MTSTEQDQLENRLGYHFQDKSLLTLALTHASASGEHDYERLEFLGDRVLGLIVAENLYSLYPHEPEGDLSKRHTALVRGETMTDAARALDAGKALRISDAEKASGGADNAHILSDIMESIIGAVYLDGGLDAARAILMPLLEGPLKAMTAPPRDPKTTLQEYSQSKNLGLPEYKLIGRDGPDHAPTFSVSVQISGHDPAFGNGSSKRLAEKAAAEALIQKLGI